MIGCALGMSSVDRPSRGIQKSASTHPTTNHKQEAWSVSIQLLYSTTEAPKRCPEFHGFLLVFTLANSEAHGRYYCLNNNHIGL